MNRYTVNPAARSDLDDIWEYVAVTKDNPDAAEKLMGSFHKTFVMLGNNPRVGLLRSDLAEKRFSIRHSAFPCWPICCYFSAER